MKHMTVDGRMTMIVRTFLTKSFSQMTKILHVLTCRYYHISLQLNDEVGLNGFCDR